MNYDTMKTVKENMDLKADNERLKSENDWLRRRNSYLLRVVSEIQSMTVFEFMKEKMKERFNV